MSQPPPSPVSFRQNRHSYVTIWRLLLLSSWSLHATVRPHLQDRAIDLYSIVPIQDVPMYSLQAKTEETSVRCVGFSYPSLLSFQDSLIEDVETLLPNRTQDKSVPGEEFQPREPSSA